MLFRLMASSSIDLAMARNKEVKEEAVDEQHER